MNKLISRMFNTLSKRLAAAGLIGLAIALPVAASAADMVKIEAQTGVANATAGDTTYSQSVNATYDQVVKVQVTYDNDEAAGSNKIANNLRVKINIPTTAGQNQTIATTTSADNSNTVNGSVSVHLDRSDAYLQYIPGSAVWKHANAQTGVIGEQVVSDAVTSSQGLVLEDENPCQAASVTVLARVMVPGVKIVKQVEKASDTNKWASTNTANPGDTLKYMITYQNIGNTQQNNVVIRDSLPVKMSLVPGTTMLYNSTNPNGVKYNSDNITNGGIVIGNYAPGAGAYVIFEVKVADATDLACGQTEFRNVGVAHPENMNEYYNTAITDVTKQCANTPTFSCTLLNVTQGDNRSVKISDFKTTATNGATFKNAVINWGDNSAALTTNNVVGQTHTYAADGNFTISAVAHFTVNGKDESTTGSCTKTVSFGTPTTPTTPTQLPNTGAGNVVAIFGAASVLGVIGHRLFLSRRLARR